MNCIGCSQDCDTRLGFCFDCATAGESRAANRNVIQHVSQGLWHAVQGWWTEARIDFTWAWERLTKTGDYKPDGYFEHQFGASRRASSEID